MNIYIFFAVSHCRCHITEGVVNVCVLFSVFYYGNETWTCMLFSSAVVCVPTFLLDCDELQLNIYFGMA